VSGLPKPNVPMAGFQPDPSADPALVNLDDYERAAREKLAPGPLAYYSGGANDERTLEDNRAAFRRRWFKPRSMRGTGAVDLGVTVLGRRWPAPVFVCPTALQRMAHPLGELATARAAAARGITFTLSTSASTDMAEIAKVEGPRWYQAYLLADPGARRAMVERAVALGFEAFVLTVDLQRLGRRERDIRAGFAIPAGVTLPNIAAAAGVAEKDAPNVPFVAALTWADLEWLAKLGRPVIVKGILRGDDARAAIDHGAAGIEVSNHGGRQLDGAIASLDALDEVVSAVQGRVPVLVDGGVRRGTDVLTALACGATAVGLGRPLIWGLAVSGEAGAGRVLDLIVSELDSAMALSGCASVAEVTRDLVVP